MVTSVNVVSAGGASTPVALGADSSEATPSLDELEISCTGTTGAGASMPVVGTDDATAGDVGTTGGSVAGVGRALLVVNGAAGIGATGSVGPLSWAKVAVLLAKGVCSVGLATDAVSATTEEDAASLTSAVVLLWAGVVLAASGPVVG